MKPKITKNSKISKPNYLAWRIFQDRSFIVNPKTSKLYELNETGTFLWKQLDSQKSIPQLANALAKEYEVSFEDALRDIQDFINLLLKKGIITLK